MTLGTFHAYKPRVVFAHDEFNSRFFKVAAPYPVTPE